MEEIYSLSLDSLNQDGNFIGGFDEIKSGRSNKTFYILGGGPLASTIMEFSLKESKE